MQACACNLSLATFWYFDLDVDGVVWNTDIACWHQLSLRSPVKAANHWSLDLSFVMHTQESDKTSAPVLKSSTLSNFKARKACDGCTVLSLFL